MRRSNLFYIGIGTFLGCWVLLFALPGMRSESALGRLLRLTEGVVANFLLLVLIFAGVSVAAAVLADSAYGLFRRFSPLHPKLGGLLVGRGFITEAQLHQALKIQKFRIGEMLLYLGCITDIQMKEALQVQQKQPDRLGRILTELGYASAEDIRLALQNGHRRLGKILVDMGLIDQENLRRVLGRQWYSRYLGY